MELTLTKRERIKHAELALQRRREQQRDLHNGDSLLVLMFLGLTAIFLGVWVAINVQWSPGKQDAVAREYRALRHEAVEVAAK